MATVLISIGSQLNTIAYDDSVISKAISTTGPVSVGAPVDSSDALRLGDLQDGSLVDGDTLDIDWTPTFYVPDASPTEALDVDDLTAHLKGIDTMLGSLVISPGSVTDNAVVRFNGVDGRVCQNSVVTISDDGIINSPTGGSYRINSLQVVGSRQAALTDASSVSTVTVVTGTDMITLSTLNSSLTTLVTEINAIKSTVNSILARLRTHGLIAT